MKTSAATMETAENKAKSILPWWRKIVEGTTHWPKQPRTEVGIGYRDARIFAREFRDSLIIRFLQIAKRSSGEEDLDLEVSRQLKRFLLFHYSSAVTAGTVLYDLWNTLPHNNYSAIGRCCSIERFFICIFIVPRPCTCVGGGGEKSSDQRNNKCAVKINGLINTSLLPAKYFSTFS